METPEQTNQRRAAELRRTTQQLRTSQDNLKASEHRLQESEDSRRVLQASHLALQTHSREATEALVVMQATLESTADGIVVTDEVGQARQFNQIFLDLWSMPRDFLQRASLEEVAQLVAPQLVDPEGFLTRLSEVLSSDGDSFDLLDLKDGRTFERYSRQLVVEGQKIGRVWSFRNITERHEADLVSQRLAAIVASSDDAIISKDLDSVITSWNFGAEKIFGYSAEEMIGTSIMRLIPFDRQAEETEILSRIRRGERFDHFETIRVRKDGLPINVSITVSPVMDAAGNVIGASKVARDITQSKKAEEFMRKAMEATEVANRERLHLLESEREARAQAERASRMKDEFLATLSHELRTPLNAVLGWTNILKMGGMPADELKQGLETIERNARAQAQIIEDLLDMSRIISGKVRLEVQPTELAAVIRESVSTVQAAADAKGLHLQVDVDSGIGIVAADAGRLQQVFWNLLNNAIKFTPVEGIVKLEARDEGSQIEIEISDTGEGIAPEFLPYVFDRFQQADASTTRKHGGLGLGLAIVKQLVELHGGKIAVESEGRGRGASFTIVLPTRNTYSVEKDRRKARAESEPKPFSETSLENVAVLVVDDEADARELVKRLLELAGAKVTMAGSASEAIEQLEEARPDVLVCDIGMPGEDGYSLIRKVRARELPGAEAIPAVALTAYARSEDRTKAIRSGFQYHLAKPVEAAELLAVVGSLAER